MHPQQQVSQGQEFSSMGWLKILWLKGKKSRQGGGATGAPSSPIGCVVNIKYLI